MRYSAPKQALVWSATTTPIPRHFPQSVQVQRLPTFEPYLIRQGLPDQTRQGEPAHAGRALQILFYGFADVKQDLLVKQAFRLRAASLPCAVFPLLITEISN